MAPQDLRACLLQFAFGDVTLGLEDQAVVGAAEPGLRVIAVAFPSFV